MKAESSFSLAESAKKCIYCFGICQFLVLKSVGVVVKAKATVKVEERE